MSLTQSLTRANIPGLDNYVLEKEINHGYFGRVYQAKETKTSRLWACKFVQKNILSDRQKRNIQREIEIMRIVSHPNIIRMKEAVETEDFYIIVMELMKGGDLFDRIQKQQTFTEEDARQILNQVASAVKYLHESGIAHRDLKIENLMFSEPDGNIIKVGDFGLAKKIGKLPTKTPVGTKEYMAPEIVKGEYYSTTVDIWSLGCLAFILLYGTFPFYNETDRRGNRLVDITEKIKNGTFTFPQEGEYDNAVVSDLAKDLIRKALVVDPAKRIDIFQFLNHPWLRTVANVNLNLNAPAAMRTAEGLVSMRDFFNVGVHTERNRVDTDGEDDTQQVIQEQKKEGISFQSLDMSKLFSRRKKEKPEGK